MRRILIFWLCLAVVGCAKNNAKNYAANEAAVENAAEVDVNASTIEMNTASNLADHGTENAGGNAAAPPPPPPPAPEADGTANVANASANVAETQVEEGLGAFVKPPEVMRPNKWYKIDFIVAVNQGEMKTEADDENTTAPKKVYIAPTMRVTLQEDANFHMKMLTPEVQPLGQAATWSWNVMALREGTFVLEAKVTPQVGAKSKTYTRKVSVQVKVGPWERVLTDIDKGKSLGDKLQAFFTSWKGALVAFLAFLGVLTTVLWRLGILKKKPQSGDPPSGENSDKKQDQG